MGKYQILQDDLSRTIGFIQYADTKASFMLTVNFGILSALLLCLPLLVKVMTVPSSPWWIWLIICLSILAMCACLVTSMVAFSHLLSVVAPRLTPANLKYSTFYFQSVAQMGESEFSRLLNRPDQEIENDIISQIYNNSVVAKRKFDEIANCTKMIRISFFTCSAFAISSLSLAASLLSDKS